MARTPEQREAEARLTDAIQAVSEAYGLPPEGFTVTDYIVVVESVRYHPDDDAAFDEYHHVLFQEGSTRSSVGIGLCRIGEQYIGDGVTASGGPSFDDNGG